MANVYKSAQVYFAAVAGADLITSPAASIVTSIQVSDNTGTITVDVKKGTGTARPIAKLTTNGEVLDAPIVLENGDKLIVTPTATGATVTASYAYSSTGGALSIDALTDVDITGIADGEILVWNATSGQFEPGVGGGGGVTSVNGDTGPTVVIDAGDIDYTLGTTVYAKLTDHQNAIVAIQDVVKYPTDKAELQEDANNKVSVDGTTGTESITLKTDGTDALVVTDQRATVNVGLNASQGLTVNFGAGSQYTMPTTSGNANEVIVSDGSGGTSFAPAALPTSSDTLEVDGIDFNLTPTATEANGRLLYDPDIESLVFLSENGNKIALGSVYLPVINKTTSTITLGTVVKFVGAEGDRFKIEAFDASADEALDLIGVVEKDIAQDGNGVVVQVGYIKGVDTSTYSVGDILYASTTAGEFTTTPPTNPDLVIPVAAVKTSASNGSIFVRPTAYHHLNDAHDVSTTAPSNEAVLAWNSTSQLWEPADNYANTTGTIFTGGIPVMTDSNTFKADTNLAVIAGQLVSTYNMTVPDLTVSTVKLNASGTAIIDGISTGDIEIKSKGSIANILDSDANETGKQFSVDDSLGNKIMVVDEGGNVGIGTASPTNALQIESGDVSLTDGDVKLSRYNEGKIAFGIAGEMWGASNGNTVYLQKSVNDHRFDFNTQGGSLTVRDTTDNTDYFTITTEGFESYSGSYFKYIQHNAANNNSGKVLEYSNASASVNRGLVQVNGDLKVNDYTTGSAVERIKLGNDGKITINDGSNNVLISSGNSTITASNTTAVGYQALTALTTGEGNTALGYQAGDGITTAGYNTVVGYSADVGTAHSGTVMGYQASGTGSGVVAIGYQAQGGTVTNGFQNTGVGYQANYTGASEKNVSIGTQAGYSGNVRSVSVGHGAGYSGADYGVFIGYQAGYNETGSNKLYIENSNSTTPLIYGEFDNDIVRVNGTVQVGDPSSTGFALPSTDGTEDQTLTTDGSGAVTWKAKAQYCQLLRSTAQTLTTTTVAWEDLVYDSETIDTFGGGSHTAGTITLSAPGVYVLNFSGEFNNTMAVNVRRVIKVRLVNNGTAIAGTERGTYQRTNKADGDIAIHYIINKTDSTTEVIKAQAQIDQADGSAGNYYHFDNGVFTLQTLST